MYAKTLMKTGLLALAAALALTGCAGDGGKRGKTTPPPAAQTPAALPGGGEIAYLTFSLPEQVRWQQNEDEALDAAGVAEWFVAGTTPQTSPARIMYQKLMPAQNSANVRAQVLKPLESCTDSKVGGLRTASKYNRQLGFEAVCSKFGETNFGLTNYVAIFTDGAANHLVLTEVRTPASDKAGELKPKNAQEQQWAETSRQLAELLRNTMQTIRACDANNSCL